MIKMTVEHALQVQAQQLAYYSKYYPHQAADLRTKLAAATTSDQLKPGVMYDVTTINRHVPRGAWFETNIPEIAASEAAIANLRLAVDL